MAPISTPKWGEYSELKWLSAGSNFRHVIRLLLLARDHWSATEAHVIRSHAEFPCGLPLSSAPYGGRLGFRPSQIRLPILHESVDGSIPPQNTVHDSGRPCSQHRLRARLFFAVGRNKMAARWAGCRRHPEDSRLGSWLPSR